MTPSLEHHNNYSLQLPSPACSNVSSLGNSVDLLDDATLSPSDSAIRFAFPPTLEPTSSSESSSVVETSQAMVPYYGPPKTTTTTPVQAAKASTTTLVTRPRRLRVPLSNNPLGADAVHPQKKAMKKIRKRKTTAGAVSGMVVGGLTLGPVGVFVGAAAGAMATNKICKARERRAQRHFEKDNFQHQAARSGVHHGALV